jgi:hypothetical protein
MLAADHSSAVLQLLNFPRSGWSASQLAGETAA